MHTPRFLRSLAAALTVCALLGVGGQVQAASETVWEYLPYRVQVWLLFCPDPRFASPAWESFPARLLDRIETTVGAPWDVQVAAAPAPLAWHAAPGLSKLDLAHLGDTTGADKVLLLRIGSQGDAFAMEAREFDVRCQRFSPSVASQSAWRWTLENDCARLLWSAFCPVGDVLETERKEATILLRAGALHSRDPALVQAPQGKLFRAVIRTTQRDGSLKSIKDVDWTFLVAGESADARIRCQLQSGMRGSLSDRRRGRIEKLALGLPRLSGSTVVRLRGFVAPKPPLVGYEVLGYTAKNPKATLLARTNRRGEVLVEPVEDGLRTLVVMSGGQPLAKLPVVPGLFPELEATVANDDPRLEVEGFVTALQESMVDLVVRRQVLLSLADRQIEDGHEPEARKLVEELRRMPTRQQFAFRVQQESQRVAPPDARSKRKVDRLFEDTRTLLSKYLDPSELESLEAKLVRLKTSAASPGDGAETAAATGAAPPADASPATATPGAADAASAGPQTPVAPSSGTAPTTTDAPTPVAAGEAPATAPVDTPPEREGDL